MLLCLHVLQIKFQHLCFYFLEKNNMEKWTQKFSEMGSRNKKTGKLKYYVVTRTHNNGVDSFKCSCPATMYRPYLTACKHIKRLKEKLLLP